MSVPENCWCGRCESAALLQKFPTNLMAQLAGRRFIVCPDCGDKRCPRAWWHGSSCQHETGRAL